MGNVAELGILISTQYAQTVQALNDVQRRMEDVAKSTGEATAASTGAIREMQQELKRVRESTEDTGNLLKSGALIGAGAALTSAVTIPLINLGRESVLLADKFHRTEVAFTTMLGSADAARTLLSDLRAFAASTPFEFPQLVRASQKMLALGFSAHQVIPTLTNVGNAVAGLDGGGDVFGRIILALGQMQAKGKVSAEEMKQLAEAGIPAWQAVATAIGVTVPEAMELAKKKQIDSATAIAAIQAGMAERFGGLMAQQSATIAGTIANMKDTMTFLMAELGQELIDTLHLRDVLAGVQSFTRDFLTWFRSLDQGTRQIALVIAGVFAVGGPILVAVGAFMVAMTVVTAPLLIGGAIVAGIIAGVTLILLNWQKIRDTGIAIWEGLVTKLTGVWEELKGTAIVQWTGMKVRVLAVVEALVSGIGLVLGKLGGILDSVRAKTEAVTGFFKQMYDAVVGHSYVPDMVTEIGEHMQKLDANLTAPARRAAISVENAFRGMQLTTTDILEDLRERASYTAGSMIQSLSGAFAGAIQGTVNWATVGQQMLNQLLTQMINMVLTWTASWVIAEATRTAATAAANATIGASTAATTTGMTAVMAGFAAFAKTIFLGLAHAVVGVLGLVVGAISVVLQAISFVLQFALLLIAKLIFAAAAAVQVIPIIGQILGAILFAAGVLVTGLAIALPAIVAGLGLALVAGVGALASAIPAFGEGGLVFGPTLALVGEQGPEVIAPLDRLGDLGGGDSVTEIYLDGELLARSVARHLQRRVYMEGVPT